MLGRYFQTSDAKCSQKRPADPMQISADHTVDPRTKGMDISARALCYVCLQLVGMVVENSCTFCELKVNLLVEF